MPLTKEQILLLVGRYEEQESCFKSLAAELHAFLADAVGSRAVRHMITHRAKGSASLERKLWKSREQHEMDDFRSALSPPIKDLAAARVLLYLPDDIDPVVGAIAGHLREKGHTAVPKDLRRPESHYSAFHFHVTCNGDAFAREGLEPETIVEIQVCTISDHLCNELEHDIIYKQPSGEPDTAQKELLVALKGELDLAARTANRLMRHTQRLISTNTAKIESADDLQFSLRSRAGRSLRGDFESLFNILNGLMDPLSHAALHECFTTGRREEEARELMRSYDPDGSQEDAGCLLLQLFPNFANVAIIGFVDSSDVQRPLMRFARRVAEGLHARGRQS